MWDFLQYTSRERAFNSLSWGSLEVVEVEAEAGVWVSKTVLRIRCKSSLEYLGALIVVAETTAIGVFALENPAGYLENFDLGDGKELGRATKDCSKQGRLESRTKVILALIVF